jgi:hypothetical protein
MDGPCTLDGPEETPTHGQLRGRRMYVSKGGLPTLPEFVVHRRPRVPCVRRATTSGLQLSPMAEKQSLIARTLLLL